MKMASKKHDLDMTQGPILGKILRYAFPIMLSSLLTHFYNAADIVVVSRFSGSNAMASVGATSALSGLLVNFFLGISIGTTIIASRRYGAKDKEGLSRALHTSVLFSILLGLAAASLGQIFCRPLLVLTGTPEGSVLDGAVLYMRIIFCGTPATVIYSFGAAAVRATGDSKRPLYILAISGAVNFLLNLVFVIVFSMGVAGVALATIISKYLNIIMLFAVLKSNKGAYEFKFRKLRLYKTELLDIIKIGTPAGFQNTFMSFANTIIQSTVNSFGAAAIAGNAAAANIESFVLSIKFAFRQGTVTAVSQNYGAKNKKRMEQCVKTSLLCMIAGCFLLSFLVVVFSKQLLGIYITDSPEAIYYGTIRLVVTALPYFLSGTHEILTGYLRGLGYSTLATTNSFISLCGFRVLYVLLIFPLNPTFWILYLGTPLTWVVLSLLNLISIKIVKKKAIQKMMQA